MRTPGPELLDGGVLLSSVAPFLSAEGLASLEGGVPRPVLLVGVGCVGALLFALLQSSEWRRQVRVWLLHDRWSDDGISVPRPALVLTAATLIGAALVELWWFRGAWGEVGGTLIENQFLTGARILGCTLAALFWLLAAVQWSQRLPRASPFAPPVFASIALALLAAGVTNPRWEPTNTVLAAGGFAAGIGVLMAFSRRPPFTLMGALAPHPALLPLAFLTAYSGLRLNADLMEVLGSLFCAFHGYRVWGATRRPWAEEPALARADVAEIRSLPAATHALAQLAQLENSEEAIILWGMGSRGIIYWNRAAEELYGYSREEAAGRRTHTLLQTQLVGGVAALENQLDRYGIFIGNLKHRTKGGRQVLVEARLTLIAQADGRWLVLEVNRDVTDLAGAEAAGRARLDRVEEIRQSRTSSS